jgi:basic membrane lipoprotein Med (substrate-binding protein (PBP1-ABC) superfamily)
MKKLVKLLAALAMCMALVLSGCSKSGSSEASGQGQKKPGAGTKKIGIVLGGTKDDYGFNYAWYQFHDALKAEFGDTVDVVMKENVAQNADVEGVMEELIAQGCGIIVATQFGYLEYTKNVSARNPQVAFYSIPFTDYLGGNFSVIHATLQDVAYCEGVLAGLYTKANKIGFIGSFPIPDVVVALDSFTLGVQLVNPNAVVSAVFTGSWSDSGLQTIATNQLIDDGCDVIRPFQDAVKTVIEISANRGVHAFGCNSDPVELDPETWLSSCTMKWEGWIKQIKKAVEGNYETVEIVGSFSEQLMDLGRFGNTVTKEIADKVYAVRQDIIDGKLHVFEGPVYAQDGSEIFPAGYKPTPEEINMVSVLVKGINGSLQ